MDELELPEVDELELLEVDELELDETSGPVSAPQAVSTNSTLYIMIFFMLPQIGLRKAAAGLPRKRKFAILLAEQTKLSDGFQTDK